MPAILKMSDDKTSNPTPVVITEVTSTPATTKKTKKYVIIAVSAILGVAIILTAILVGMHMFTQAQKELIKYTLDFHDKVKQEVVSDPNTNIVQYHVTNDGHESWIVNDFNKDIQVVKIQTEKETVCYMNALNRSLAADPSKVAKPNRNNMQGNSDDSVALTYMTSNTPVSDTSFLPKAARDMCKGISVYWVYPHCADKSTGPPPNGTDISRSERQSSSSCYRLVYYKYLNYYIPCVTMCCRTICACYIRYSCYLNSYGYVICNWYYTNCPPYIYGNPLYNGYNCPS